MSKITIVTHNSGFHTDDVFAVATLSLLLEKDNEIVVIRSRDINVIEKADYVVDVGDVYDPKIKRFDHHQAGGAGKRENGIPYASFGLVWKEFGEGLSGSKKAFEKIDKAIVQSIDANDNGVSFLESKIDNLRPFDIGFLTFMFYPTWKEDIIEIDKIFLDLVSYAKVIISREIKCVQDELEVEELVVASYESSGDKRLVLIENSRYPWEPVLSKFREPLFAIYQNINAQTWTIKGVRDNIFSYKIRKNLPESWAGKRDEELEKICGVSGAVFCHNNRFMAVNKTKEGILKMAEIALKD